MRRSQFATIAFLGASLAATSLSAQSMPSPREASAIARSMNGDAGHRQFRSESDAERLQREAADLRDAEARYGADRLAVAQNVQALIDAGRCAEARAAALEAGERRIALRVRQTCRSR